MKKTLTLFTLLTGLLVSAQEAGKTGELLKNEANSKEMQAYRTDMAARSAAGSRSAGKGTERNVSDYSNTARNRGNDRNSTSRYNWHQDSGYSEVFLRIPEYGYFTVEIDEQMMSNGSGKFRFFDLPSGKMPVSIYQNGYLIYRTQLNVRHNTRIVLDFFTNYGLYLLDSYTVQGRMYGIDQWDDVWNTTYGKENRESGRNRTENTMDNRSFDHFVQTMNKTASFDKDKLAFISQQAYSNRFTSQQIKTLLNAFSFDDKKLEAAKLLYSRCADVSNFYIVYEAFDFDKGKRALMDYVSGQH